MSTKENDKITENYYDLREEYKELKKQWDDNENKDRSWNRVLCQKLKKEMDNILKRMEKFEIDDTLLDTYESQNIIKR